LLIDVFFDYWLITPVNGITWRAVMKKMAEITKGLIGQPMFKLLRIAEEMDIQRIWNRQHEIF